jgi:hypothetical protein
MPDQWKKAACSINPLPNCFRKDCNTAMKWTAPGKFTFMAYNAIMMPFSYL